MSVALTTSFCTQIILPILGKITSVEANDDAWCGRNGAHVGKVHRELKAIFNERQILDRVSPYSEIRGRRADFASPYAAVSRQQ